MRDIGADPAELGPAARDRRSRPSRSIAGALLHSEAPCSHTMQRCRTRYIRWCISKRQSIALAHIHRHGSTISNSTHGEAVVEQEPRIVPARRQRGIGRRREQQQARALRQGCPRLVVALGRLRAACIDTDPVPMSSRPHGPDGAALQAPRVASAVAPGMGMCPSVASDRAVQDWCCGRARCRCRCAVRGEVAGRAGVPVAATGQRAEQCDHEGARQRGKRLSVPAGGARWSRSDSSRIPERW